MAEIENVGNTPWYYLLEGREHVYQCADLLNLLENTDHYETLAIGNIFKYLVRAGRKTDDPMPDIDKGRNCCVMALEHRAARLAAEGTVSPEMPDTIDVALDAGAAMPSRSHPDDAGLDLRAASDATVPAHGFATVGTGTHVEIPRGFAGVIHSRSGLNSRSGITADGVVDAGYTGEVCVTLHNGGAEPYVVEPGDRIAQMLLVPVATPTPRLVDAIDGCERGDAGFGSTGR